jgi:molybdopterin-containing oxidoreductase family membrane subunit
VPERGVFATFTEPAPAARAVRRLRERGFTVRAVMPAPFPELVSALGRPKSPIQWVTFPGALIGLLLGIALTAGTSLAWPLVTGGKPIVSVPPFVVVIFELTVLVGSLTNLAAVAVATRLGARAAAFPTDVAHDAQLVALFAAGADPGVAEEVLHAAGAEEVRRVG